MSKNNSLKNNGFKLFKIIEEINNKTQNITNDTDLNLLREKNQMASIIKLINEGVNFNVKDNDDNNILLYILENEYIRESLVRNNPHILQIVIDGTDLSHANANNITPLLSATQHNLKVIAEMIINEDPDTINQQDRYKNTPLMNAARNGATDMMRLLVSKEADIEVVNNKGYSALHIALDSRQFNSALFLITEIQSTFQDFNDDYSSDKEDTQSLTQREFEGSSDLDEVQEDIKHVQTLLEQLRDAATFMQAFLHLRNINNKIHETITIGEDLLTTLQEATPTSIVDGAQSECLGEYLYKSHFFK